MARFVEPSEYGLLSTAQLKAELSLLETVVYIQKYFYLDHLKQLVSEYGPEVIRSMPTAYLRKACLASRAVAEGKSRIGLLEQEVRLRE